MSSDHEPDQTVPPDSTAPDAGSSRPVESLRRELYAILVLYVILSILPLLIGLATGP